jgi:preprotein translocase subunit SecG
MTPELALVLALAVAIGIIGLVLFATSEGAGGSWRIRRRP